MTEQPTPEKSSWWQTMPGILTASATVITAVTGLLIALKPSVQSQPAQTPNTPASSALETPSTSSSPVEANTSTSPNNKPAKNAKKAK